MRLLALWLAAFWLPLTMHCQLMSLKICCAAGTCCEESLCGEGAGDCSERCACHEAPGCHSDGCKIVESGNYFLKNSSPVVPVASADAATTADLPGDDGRLPEALVLTESTGAPPGWSRVWQFVCRAALAPRAPSAVC